MGLLEKFMDEILWKGSGGWNNQQFWEDFFHLLVTEFDGKKRRGRPLPCRRTWTDDLIQWMQKIKY